MLWKRLLSSLVIAPTVLLIVWFGGLPYKILSLLFTLITLFELSNLLKTAIPSHRTPLAISLGLLFCLPAFTTTLTIHHILFFSIFIVFAVEIFFDGESRSFLSAISSLFASFYIGWAFGYHTLILRDLDRGAVLLFFLLSIVWISDSTAYFVGKRFGRNKLRPNISPNKTIEGAIGGLIAAIATGLIVWKFFLIEMWTLENAVIASLIIGITSQISDLSESIIKRFVNVKDSGTLIPGHGGVLDRIDSLIFSAPAFYYFVTIVIQK